MKTGHMNWWIRFATLSLAVLLVSVGCSEQPVDVRGERDAVGAENTDAMFQDILGFLDSYASGGLAAGTDPTLIILGPSNDGSIEYIEPATSVDFVMMVENWDYPDTGRTINCYVDGGQFSIPLGTVDGDTDDLEYTFPDVPHGWHRLCCVLVENGVELGNCEAAACVDLVLWQTCDYLSDPVCNDFNPVSAEACLFTGPNPEQRVCTYGPVDVDDICLSKYDCDCIDDIGFELCIDNHCVPCAVDADCDDGEPCTEDLCNFDGLTSSCSNEWAEPGGVKCCSSTATEGTVCNDGFYCTSDLCTDVDPVSGVGHCANPDAGFPDCCDSHADCQDGDPCTVNACMMNECREGPKDDPLCCNPANGNADCEKGDPCVHSVCLESTDQCQWTALTYQEQVDAGLACCENHPDCQDGGIWEESPQDDPSTLDFCQNGQCVHVTNEGYCECDEGEGCPYPCMDDGVGCTDDSCNLAINDCEHNPILGCCVTDDDCDDWDLCTDDTCVNEDCQHDPVPESEGCCNTHLDCEDDNPCNIDACMSGHCHYGPDPVQPNCCVTDSDCDDDNDCTTEVCHTDTHECLMDVTEPPPAGKECCLTAAQCDDQNNGTQDVCNQHQCYHFPVNCVEGDSCHDYQVCTTDSCDTDTGLCDNVWIDLCCSSDLACNLPPLMPDTPEYYCQEGACSPDTHTCVFTDIVDCCLQDSGCLDGDDCTGDFCVNKKCKHIAVANCCANADECNDNNACTVDTCVGSPGQCSNVADPSQPGFCCDSNGACADEDDWCTEDYCLDHYCYHDEIPGCCNDENEDVKCPDTNPCTCDLCIYGICRHIPPDQAANYPDCDIPLTCCTEASDCESDDNPCTVDDCVNNLCVYVPMDPCTEVLPYFQTFDNCNNVQTDQGWLIANGFSFVDLGTTAAIGNWECSTDDDLGPDKHERFNWAPTVADFDTYLITPALDCVGYDYVTVMYRHELEYYDDVTPKTDIDLGLYLIEDTAGGDGPDALDTYHEIEGDSYQVDVTANWAYASVPTTTGLLEQETFFAWQVGGETSYAMNHFDLDDVRVCPGRPPIFSNPSSGQSTIAMRMDDTGLFYFDVKDLDDTQGQDLNFTIEDGPSWVEPYGYIWDSVAKDYSIRVRIRPKNDPDKIGVHTFTLRATDKTNNGCLYAEVEVTLWVLVNDGYVVWDPEDEDGNHSDGFASTIAASIDANDRMVQTVEDITLFDDLDGIRGVFVTLGVQGLDYVLTDHPSADADAIDLISNYLADGGNVYMEGGNTWGFDSPTDLHSQYYFPVNAMGGAPAKYGETFPPGAVDGKHFCWGEDFSVMDSATLSYAVDILLKKVGSSAIPIMGDATVDHEVVISYESADYGCRTIAATLPFAALEEGGGTFDGLMAKYIDFFENGYPSCLYNEQCFDSEVCTVDTCVADTCQNLNEPDCIPCEDDVPCTASLATKACAVSSGICGTIPGDVYDDTAGSQTITYGADVTSTVTVAGTDLVQQVNAKIYISHNYRGDLEIKLAHSGHEVVLKDPDPTDNGKHNYFTYDFGLDSNEMDVFLDEGENGPWTLKIIDHGVPFDGALLGWTLFVVSDEEPCTVDGDCNDENACTIDSCESGFCAFTADPCDDVNACVYFDSCDPDVGCIYGDVNCDDSFVCTVDSCHPVTGCANVLIQHCTNICTSHADCGYDDYCDLSGGSPGACTPIPNDVTVYCEDCPKTVPDQATITSAVSMSDTTHYIDQIYVKVKLLHTYQGQLTLTLSNGDATVTLHELTGGSADNVFKVYEIADPVHVPGALDGLNDFHPDGIWTLSITDGAAGDIGSLDYWTIYVINHDLLNNGEICGNEDMCTSDYCGNGFCCNGTGTGDCCAVLANCQNGGAVTYWVDPVCDTAATCQGHRIEPLCTNNECVATDIDDDSACDGALAAPCLDCRPNPVCNADEDQDDAKVRCPDTCGNDDSVCETTCFCDGTIAVPTGICVDLLGLGDACAEESDCDGGLHCQNGVCCPDGEICCTVWSQCPNEVGVVSPLTQNYSDPECGATPTSCQGTREDKACVNFQCGASLVEDDTDCGLDIIHSYCGFYPTVTCDATLDQTPACATSCVIDADCDANAHCTAGECIGDYDNGHTCDEADGAGNNECVSDHCQNGFCCTAGDCCTVEGDCAGLGYDVAPWCHDAATCQGYRQDAVCVTNTCETSAAIDDDSACDLLLGCAPYVYDYCDGTVDQPIAECPTICVDDTDCITGAHCAMGEDSLMHCFYDKLDCETCTGDWDCVSGNCNGPVGQEVCCAAGHDCVPTGSAALCPVSYSSAADCNDPEHCQGTREDATETSCVCGTLVVDDDSACTAAVTATGIDCACFPHPICDGAVSQNPTCATTCTLDTECLAGCTCEGACVSKLSNGEICDEDTDCFSEHCAPGGICCDFECDGTCEACTLTWDAMSVAIDGDYDGVDDFDSLGHRLGTGTEGIYYLLTWDDDYIYAAWEGVDLSGDNVYIAFDIDKDPNPAQGAMSSYGGVSFGGDRKPEYAMVIHLGDSITYSPHDGAGGWDTAQDVCPFPANCWSHYAGWSGNKTSELRIPRAYLGGLDPDAGFAVWMWASNNAEDWVFDVWPDTNPTGGGVQDAQDAQFMKLGSGQCTKRAYNTDATDECVGDCHACDGLGACMDALTDSDPNNDCAASTPESCGLTGDCGVGACAYWDATTPCLAASCSADGNGDVTVLNQSSLCSGAGACVSLGTVLCFPHLCITDACKEPCEVNPNCVQVLTPGPGYYCNNRALNGAVTDDCELKLADALYCDEDSDCVSGHCVEIGDVGQGVDVGVCCATACNGHCNSCVTGACTNYADFTDVDLDCGGCEVCDGSGACRPVDPVADPLGDPKFFCAQNPLPIADTEWDCGFDGECDGLGECRKWHSGEICHSSECMNCAIEDQPDYCDAEGFCHYMGPGDPCIGGLNCENAILCRTVCSADAHCCGVVTTQLCHADGACDPCDDSAVCPTDGSTCCQSDACGDVKGILASVGTLSYYTATEGATDDFSLGGLGVNAPDRVFTFTTGTTPLTFSVTVTGTKDGGAPVDTLIYLREVYCETGIVVASDDDCGGDPAAGSCFSLNVKASKTYYLVIDGKGGPTDKGDITLTATFDYYCGNGVCDPGEVCGVCADCSPCCGDGSCDVLAGENSCVCSTDCDDALASDNACNDGCCSTWDCNNQCGDDCDMCNDCYFCFPPVGALESVTHLAGDTFTVTGWACDPDHLSAAVSVEIYDEFGGDTLEGTFSANVSRPDLVGEPGNVCGAVVGFSGTITLAEEGAHMIKAFGLNVDVTEAGAWLDPEICQGVCGTKVCGDDGCSVSCGTCVASCVADGDGTYSAASTVCTLGQCADLVACGVAYACDGALSKEDGDVCAAVCLGDDDDYCADDYTCEGTACVSKIGNGLACDEDNDCASDNCRKEINSANYYCAAEGRECSDLGGDGYEAGGVEDPWICTATDVSVECAAATRCDVYYGRFCDNDNFWTLGDGTSYTCAVGDYCASGLHYANTRCNGVSGNGGACDAPGDFAFGCSDETLLGSLHCEDVNWITVGTTSCCEDDGAGAGVASDPCAGKHVECVDSRTCADGADFCQMVAEGTTCDVNGYCVATDPDWCASGKANGEECAGDYECASKHCDPDLAGVDRCHATETSCVQDITGAETINGAGFCVTATGWRLCTNATWGGSVNNCVGCESCVAGACQDDNDNCVQSDWDGCIGSCFKTRSNSGLCIAGVCGTETTAVTEGFICDGTGAEQAPSASGYCDATIDCTLADCAAPLHYRGCNAIGTACSDTGEVAAGSWNAPLGAAIAVTESGVDADIGNLSCQTTVGLLCDSTAHCTGDDWYEGYTCDGTGTCDVDLNDLGCCAHSDCSGSKFCETDHICKDLLLCQKADTITGIGAVWQEVTEDLLDECTDSGWDGCDGDCGKTKSNTGLCSGTGPVCGTDASTLTAGNVCQAGAEVNPGTGGIYCDMAVTCATGSCTAQTHYRGCSASGSGCVDINKQDAAIWTAPSGEVIAETTYKLGSTCVTDSEALCQASPHCEGDLYYDGYTCNGAGVCDLGDQTSGCCKSSACATSEYCLLTTHTCTDLPVCTVQQGDNGYTFQLSTQDLWDDCADAGAYDGCIGTCLKTKSNTGLCSGTGQTCGIGTDFVAEGKVCDAGTEVAPSETIRCSGTIDCVDGACSALRYSLGCSGIDTTCVETDKVAATTWNVLLSEVIDTTEYKIGLTCSTAADYCLVVDHCAGDDWYAGYSCGGDGTCTADMGDQGCCDHADCGSAEYCNEVNHACTALPLCAKRTATAYGYSWQTSLEDQRDECDPSGWDGCASACVKTTSNTGFCSGTGSACGAGTENVILDGKVCAGPGLEVSPSVTAHCDTAIDCVDNACAADRWYRGCAAGTTTCTDTGHVATTVWYTPAGNVIDETASHTGADLGDVSCSTDASSCDDTDHCTGDDWYTGHTCNGTGTCDQSLGDIGCCNHTDCAGTEFCQESDHTCTALLVCTKRSATAFGYVLQADTEDLRDDCGDSDWDGCIGTCQKTKSNTGFCSGAGQNCGTQTDNLTTVGKVCDGGMEVDPSATIACDTTIDCATGECSVATYHRGCVAGGTTCVDDNRQTGSDFYAPIGTVIDETIYQVGTTCSTSSTGYCQLQGHCVGDDWYAGYLCSGGGACDVHAGDIGCCENTDCGSQQYCDLGTHLCTVLPLCTMQHTTLAYGYENQALGDDLFDECAIGSWDGCVGACVKTRSAGNFCDGNGTCGEDTAFVTAAGTVCDGGNEVAASQAINCTATIDCTSGACAATRYWLGCSTADTSCVETNKVTAATGWNAPLGFVINATDYKVGASCQTADIFCGTTDHCSGDDWYDGYTCDGAGTCTGDKDDLGCCDHSDCGATLFCQESDHTCTALPVCTKRSATAFGNVLQTAVEDQRDECDPSGWDGCLDTCTRSASETGFCSGTAAACGTDSTPVSTAGKVCLSGNEVAPAGAVFCDVTIDCATTNCSAAMWYRGCDGSGTTCDDTDKVSAGTWYAGSGVVINEIATYSEAAVGDLSCATADIFCIDTDHCSGNDYFSGYSCDGSGSCSLSQTDIGCCNHTDCGSTEYCNASNHACTALPLCTKRSMTDFGYDWQTTSEDDRNECATSGYDGCDGTCQKTMSNTGFCSGIAATCGTQTDFLTVAGKVCSGGTEVNPSVSNACDSTIACVDNACAANTYHRGCSAGATSCVDTNRQPGTVWFAASGAVTNKGEYLVAASCPTNTTDLCSAVGHCVGKDYFEGYVCDGAGACNINQNDVGCCTSVDCPMAEEYCNIITHACEDLPLCTDYHATLAYGYQNQPYGDDLWGDCTPGAWDDCETPCAKRATGGDNCDGNGACIPFEIAFVAHEKVCLAGMEVAPSATAYCDQTIDCVTGACSASRYFRGCSGVSDACTDSGPVAAPVWYSGAGNVVNQDAYKVSGACTTSSTAFCDSTNHCTGNDWWDGYTCDAIGGCTGDKDDLGCCLDSDCAEDQYCQISSHACASITIPTILTVVPLTSFTLNSMLGQVDVTWTGTLPAGYEYNLDEVSPSGAQAYYGTGTNFSTAVLDDNVLHCYRVRTQDAATPTQTSAWSATVCAFTPDRTPTFEALAGHSAVSGASNRIDTSFTAEDSGLVIYMPFEEGSGGVTNDRASGTDPAISGAAWTTGYEGGAIEFDGVNNDFVGMLDTGQMALFTLSAWIYNGSGGDERHQIVQSYWEILGSKICFWSYDFAHDYWRCSDTGSVPQDAWSYVATTWDGSVIRHYVDGELVWTDPATSSGTSQNLTTIGGNAGRKMKGKVDEFRIYNRTLDAREIRDDMAGGVITHNLFRSREENGSWVPKYSARSCTELGWGGAYGSTSVCGASSVPGCYPTKTWAEANEICQTAGGRVCTWSELNADETRGTGCDYDSARVWTSTQCATDSYWTQAGGTNYLGTFPKQCTTAATGAAVRCCADATPLLSTSSIQDSESWDWNPPSQPNAPVVTVLSDTALGVSWTGPADQGVTYYYYTKTFDNEGNESNFMDHPSFEDATDHYPSNSYGSYTFATDAAHTGTYSLKATGGAVEYEMEPAASLFEPGGTYRLAAWVREDPASTGCDQYLHARWWFVSGSPVTTTGGDVPADGAWHQTTTTITLPSTQGAITKVSWYLGYDPDCSGSRWMDDVEIVRITSASLTSGTKDFEVEETTSHSGASGYGWGSAITYDDTGLTGSTQYCYRIRARDQGLSEAAWSTATCATTDSSCIPLTATDGEVDGADSGQVCDGGTVSLTATASGGSCTGQIQYRWYNGVTFTSWDPDSSYSPVVTSDTTFTVYARCNDCAVPEVSDDVVVTLYQCCNHTDCLEGNYCESHLCAPCSTATHCATIPNCRNGTAGCCDLDTECAALQYCDDGDNSGTRKYACENAVSLPRGTSTGVGGIATGTYDDVGWYANFTTTADACVLYDVYDAEDSTQFDIFAAKSKLVDAAGGGDVLWLNYKWYDLSANITSTGNQVVEFDATTCCHEYRNVMLGWMKSETGATDGGASTSCCNASTDCVDDYVVNSAWGCYDTNSWYDTGGGHGAEAEQCRSGVWYTPDADQTTCTNGGFTWFTAVSSGSYSPCCGDDAGADDFYHHSATPATATTVNCRRCLDGGHHYTAGLHGNGWSSGTNTTCYYGDITCNQTTASHGATCTMTSTSSKCVAGTTAAQGCGVHGLWTGAVSTDWFNTSNWDDSTLPGSGSAVTIPNGKSYYPNITSGAAHAASIVINSAASVTINGGSLQVHSYVPTYTPEGIRNYGTLTATSGTLTLAKGILNRNGTVNFNGATVTLGSHLYNYNGYTSNRIYITAGTVTTASIPNYEGKIVMSGGTLNNNGYYRELDSGGGTFEGNGGTVNFGGSSDIRLRHAGSYFPTVNITGTRSINTDSDRAFKINGHFTINSGKSLDSNSEPIEIRRDWVNNGTFTADSGTVTFNGTTSGKLRGSNVTTFYDLVIDGPDGWYAVENGTGDNGGINVNVSNDLTINECFEINDKTSGSVTIDVGRDLIIPSGGDLNANDTGTWTFIRVGRNWTKSGAFSAGVNTRVYMDDASQVSTVSGNTSFRDFYVEVPGKRVDFTAGSTQTVKGTFRIAGTSGAKVLLRSTSTSQWLLNNTGGGAASINDVHHVDVQRSNANGGNLIDARDGGVDSISGSNDNWLFAVGNGHICSVPLDCESGNCDLDWYGIVKRCHANASMCVNDGTGAETAHNGYWQCVETGDDKEGASTKKCVSGTWTAQNCSNSGQYCNGSGVCSTCTSATCGYQSCRDGVNGGCCDVDTECSNGWFCEMYATSASNNPAYVSCSSTEYPNFGEPHCIVQANKWHCEPSYRIDRGYMINAGGTNGYKSKTVGMGGNSASYPNDWWLLNDAKQGGYGVHTSSSSSNLCIGYVYDPCSVGGTLEYKNGAGTHGSLGALDRASPPKGAGCVAYAMWVDLGTAAGGSTGQFSVNFNHASSVYTRNVYFGYKRNEAGATDGVASEWCCNSSTDCVDDAPAQGVSDYNNWRDGSGCYNNATCRDTDSSASVYVGGKEYCDSGTWRDQDYSPSACNCADACGYPNTSRWAIGGECSTTTCCGDDLNEHKKYRIAFPKDDVHSPAQWDWPQGTYSNNDRYWVNWSGSSTDDGCCGSNTECVWNGVCYSSGTYRRLDGYNGADQTVRCDGGEWKDLDGNQSWCTAANFLWVNSNTAWGAVGEYANDTNGGRPDTATECCGDDANEYRWPSGSWYCRRTAWN